MIMAVISRHYMLNRSHSSLIKLKELHHVRLYGRSYLPSYAEVVLDSVDYVGDYDLGFDEIIVGTERLGALFVAILT